jgi:opacity protein-like surface antigen
MKKLYCCLFACSLFALSLPLANAQTAFNVAMGFGSFHDSSNGGGLEGINSLNPFGTCIPGSLDSLCQATGGMGGFFLGFGADLMVTKRLGVNFEANIHPTHANYGPLLYRQTFYDFNGIYAPISTKRFEVQALGGIGGSRTAFSVNQSGCVGTAVCSNQIVPIGNANHFLIHAGIGVEIFVTDHIFVRPQFDYYFVPGLTDQFNSNSVPGGSIWVGYNFGER